MPWYKHWWGIVIIISLAVIMVMALLFVWLVFQEVEQIRRGGSAAQAFTSANLPRKGTTESAFQLATFDDPFFGPANAKVTVVEFSDFQCPYCRQAFPIVRELEAIYKDKVRFVYRDFPLETIHEYAFKAAEAGQCANDQGKFWPYHDKVFQNQERMAVPDLKNYAKQIGLEESKFNTCLDSGKYAAEVARDFQDGVEAGAGGTPTWFINGRKVEGVVPMETFRRIIDLELAKASK